jgi:hypothetical protein
MSVDRFDIPSLLADLARVENLPQENLPALLGDLERVRAALWRRLLADRHEAPLHDRLLTIGDAAIRLAVTKDWLRRHADLPFVVRLSEGQVRYSEQGLERFIRDRQHAKDWR